MQAKRKPLSFQMTQFNNVLLRAPGPVLGYEETMVTGEESDSLAYWNKLIETARPIRDLLESGEIVSESGISDISEDSEEGSKFSVDPSNQFLVPSSLVERWGSAMGMLAYLLFHFVQIYFYFCNSYTIESIPWRI